MLNEVADGSVDVAAESADRPRPQCARSANSKSQINDGCTQIERSSFDPLGSAFIRGLSRLCQNPER